jgi:hypothetical protein
MGPYTMRAPSHLGSRGKLIFCVQWDEIHDGRAEVNRRVQANHTRRKTKQTKSVSSYTEWSTKGSHTPNQSPPKYMIEASVFGSTNSPALYCLSTRWQSACCFIWFWALAKCCFNLFKCSSLSAESFVDRDLSVCGSGSMMRLFYIWS